VQATGPKRAVWDVPTRLFHWGIVILLGFSWWSAENDRMEWHYKSGLTVCALVLFRLLWGLAGSSTARFAGFVKGPGAVWRYVRSPVGKNEGAAPGHNPLGGWSVLVLLGLLTLQVASGLFAVDLDGLESGPLSYLVDFERGRIAAEIHEVSFNLLLAAAALHVIAVLFYLVARRRNLIRAMIVGYERGSSGEAMVRAPKWRVAAALALALAVTYAISTGFRF
jgi:cytochrome b